MVHRRVSAMRDFMATRPGICAAQGEVMRTSMFGAAVLATLAATTGSALADDWQSAAIACTVDADSIRADRQGNPGSHMSFASGQTGAIKLFCPLPIGASGNAIAMTYRDATGRDTGAGVSAEVRRINKSNGSTSSLPGAVIDSDDFATTSTAHHFDTFTQVFDHTSYYYFVTITLTRSTAAQDVTIGGVELFHVEP
jgi:hypothetical protein